MSSARPWRCVSGTAGRLRLGGRSLSRGGREGGLGWTSEDVVGPAIVFFEKKRRRPSQRERGANENGSHFFPFFFFLAPLSLKQKKKMHNAPASSTDAAAAVLAAALENRAGEIGLAFLDTRRGR